MSGQQQQQQQRFDNSAGSRASVASMPMITETGEINRAIPKIPLRVPQKNPRRSLPPGGAAALPPLQMPPVSAAYVPPSPISKEDASDVYTTTPYSARPSTPPAFLDNGVEDEKHWTGHRERRCRFLVLVGILTAVIVGLAVGLSVGLNKSTSRSTSGGGSDGNDGGSANFPAGSFSLDAYLRSNSSGCTSRSTTWNCYPNSDGGRITFHWTVTSPDSKSFSISSDETPFSRSFNNLPMTLLDANQDSERLTFAFSANRTVVPVDANSPVNRAANCTYPGTVFQATLWTRRKGQTIISPPKGLSDFAAWPGDVQVYQFKNSTIGQPYCVDQFGHSIADVQAGGGSCECRYTSSSLQ